MASRFALAVKTPQDTDFAADPVVPLLLGKRGGFAGDYAFSRIAPPKNPLRRCRKGARWRHSVVTAQRTMQEWVHSICEFVDVHLPDAQQTQLVMDNLNTLTGGSLYATFPPAEAKCMLDRLDIHYIPKHASWLNMAEIEIGIMNRQCLNRRIDDIAITT